MSDAPISGKIFTLDRANVDTDQIIATRWLGSTEGNALAAYCLAGVPGIDELYAAHPDATILVTRDNFGAGSSREHAVWALQARGFGAVIAPSFARIFEENAYNNAFLLARVPAESIDALLSVSSVRIDVREQRIEMPDGASLAFVLDPLRKEFLVGGGFLPYMAGQIETVRAWEAERATG